MTEPRSPLDAALDLFVYAPLGLALTAAEELPKLADKGRRRLGQRLSDAGAIGRSSVAEGRKHLARVVDEAAAPISPLRQRISRTEARSEDPSFDQLLGRGRSLDEADVPDDEVDVPDDEVELSPEGMPHETSLRGDIDEEVNNLAIPGYDSLAASQVVPRLAGLSTVELAAVEAYEIAHRARRTILTRVRQLQGK